MRLPTHQCTIPSRPLPPNTPPTAHPCDVAVPAGSDSEDDLLDRGLKDSIETGLDEESKHQSINQSSVNQSIQPVGLEIVDNDVAISACSHGDDQSVNQPIKQSPVNQSVQPVGLEIEDYDVAISACSRGDDQSVNQPIKQSPINQSIKQMGLEDDDKEVAISACSHDEGVLPGNFVLDPPLVLTVQQKRRIEDSKEEALRRRRRKISDATPQTPPATYTVQPACNAIVDTLTEQQRSRIEHNKKEVEQRKRRRITGKTTCNNGAEPQAEVVGHDPFGEFQDDHGGDDFDQMEDGFSHTPASQEAASSSSGSSKDPIPPPLGKPAKHNLASAKLKQAKFKADETWRQHLSSSSRIAQLLGPASHTPVILEEEGEDIGPARFKVHPSHRTMAIRSIVYCKACGYWASKKSQKLQEPCPTKPLHSDGAHKLRRMLTGLHPDAKVKEWPDGHDARVPALSVAIDWSSSM